MLKPLHVKKTDKDVVLGVYMQAPRIKTHATKTVEKINEYGEISRVTTVVDPPGRDDRCRFRGLTFVSASNMTGLKNGGDIAGVKVDNDKKAFRDQLAQAAEVRKNENPLVHVIQIAPPLLVEVVPVSEAAPPPSVEVVPVPEAAPLPVEVVPVPEAAPLPVEVGDKPKPRYPKRDRKQKVQDKDGNPVMQCQVSKSARHIFGAAVRGNTGL